MNIAVVMDLVDPEYFLSRMDDIPGIHHGSWRRMAVHGGA